MPKAPVVKGDLPVPLPENVRCQAELLLFGFCQQQVPDHLRDQYHLAFRIRENVVTLYRCYGPQRFAKSTRAPIAQFRYDPGRLTWSLFWDGGNSRWHLYEAAEPTHDLAKLLAEVTADPTGIFDG